MNRLKNQRAYLAGAMDRVADRGATWRDNITPFLSDLGIVNLDLNVHPCGTLEEIFLANRQKKPIIIHMVQGKDQTPDWLFGTIPHQMIFSSWDDIKEYLSHINSSENIDTYRRWYFFSV
jgi:hypothetical protein